MFGILANALCMLFYLIGPFYVNGMSKTEPYCALGVAGLWGIYGLFYLTSSSKKRGKEVILTQKPATS